jgi:ISXO2-like transposase domain/Transposase zinc-ribbon domain
MDTPKTLQEAIIYFSNPDNCISYLSAKRWKDGIVRCPNCGTSEVKFMSTRRVWQCKTRHPKSQFSIKVGTIYEDSAIGIDKWLTATWMVSNCKNGVSSYEIHRSIGVTQKTAWFMLHRIRVSMEDNNREQLTGMVEIDETFVGGKVRNMHKSRRPKGFGTQGGNGKAIVLGMLQRGGKVRAGVVPARTKPVIDPIVTMHVEAGTQIITDEHPAYRYLSTEYIHDVINHAERYVQAHIHTNGIENFWSLLKRSLHGTYIKAEPFHLDAYVIEQAFRYNNRATPKNPRNDSDRFCTVVGNAYGRRLTYKQL